MKGRDLWMWMTGVGYPTPLLSEIRVVFAAAAGVRVGIWFLGLCDGSNS